MIDMGKRKYSPEKGHTTEEKYLLERYFNHEAPPRLPNDEPHPHHADLQM